MENKQKFEDSDTQRVYEIPNQGTKKFKISGMNQKRSFESATINSETQRQYQEKEQPSHKTASKKSSLYMSKIDTQKTDRPTTARNMQCALKISHLSISKEAQISQQLISLQKIQKRTQQVFEEYLVLKEVVKLFRKKLKKKNQQCKQLKQIIQDQEQRKKNNESNQTINNQKFEQQVELLKAQNLELNIRNEQYQKKIAQHQQNNVKLVHNQKKMKSKIKKMANIILQQQQNNFTSLPQTLDFPDIDPIPHKQQEIPTIQISECGEKASNQLSFNSTTSQLLHPNYRRNKMLISRLNDSSFESNEDYDCEMESRMNKVQLLLSQMKKNDEQVKKKVELYSKYTRRQESENLRKSTRKQNSPSKMIRRSTILESIFDISIN